MCCQQVSIVGGWVIGKMYELRGFLTLLMLCRRMNSSSDLTPELAVL